MNFFLKKERHVQTAETPSLPPPSQILKYAYNARGM